MGNGGYSTEINTAVNSKEGHIQRKKDRGSVILGKMDEEIDGIVGTSGMLYPKGDRGLDPEYKSPFEGGKYIPPIKEPDVEPADDEGSDDTKATLMALERATEQPNGYDMPYIDITRLKDTLDILLDVANNNAIGGSQYNNADIEYYNHLAYDTAFLCERVLEHPSNYVPGAAEMIIRWINDICKIATFFPLFKDMYASHVIKHSEAVALKGEEVSSVYLEALNNIVKMNQKTINVVIKEKQKEYEPIVKYITKLKALKKI